MTRQHPRRRWFRRPRPTARFRHEDRFSGDRLPESTHILRGLR